jgi:choline-sulfatase
MLRAWRGGSWLPTAKRGRALAASLALLSTGLLFGAAAPQEASPTNSDVILVTIDTLRADHLGSYGYKKIETPNLDALARSSVRFAQANTPVPITLPSHAAILTGTYPMATGIHDFSGNKLSPDAMTLARVLRNRGYLTAAFVSAAVLDSRFGLNAGFDTYYDHFDFSRLDETNLDLMERRGDHTVDLALAWLRDHAVRGVQPLFLWVHLYDPHYPYTPPEPYATRYQGHPYDGEIAFADAQAGRLFAFLKDRGVFTRAIIVVNGDHGEGLGEHGEKTHGFFIYNSTLRVHLIIKVPGVSPRVVESEVSLIDIMPTVLEALKFPIPASVEGRSLLPEMQGRPAPPRELYAETYLPLLHFHWSQLRGVGEQGLKYIEAPRPEVYDTLRDPNELTNVASRRPAVAHELRSKLLNLVSRDTPGASPAQKVLTDPILLERLKSLGYVAMEGGAYADAKGQPLPDPKDRIQVYELFSEALSDGQHGRYRESLAKLREAEKTEPASLPVRYLEALDEYRLKDYHEAIRRFRAALQLDPKFALATYYLGLTQIQTGDLDAAAASLQHALELDPTNFSAAFDLGALFLKRARVDDAISEFQKALVINPNYAGAYEALGEVYLYQGRKREAVDALERALKLEPDFAKAHSTLGRAYQAEGRTAEAQREFDLAKRQGGGVRE